MLFQVLNPHFREEILEKLKFQHFMHLMGFNLTVIEPGHVEGEMDMEVQHQQQFGILHGGATATVADIVAGFSVYTLAPPDKDVVTGEIKVTYLRPGIGKRVRAVGRVLKPGRHFSYAEADVFVQTESGDEIHIARASTSMAIIDKFKPHR